MKRTILETEFQTMMTTILKKKYRMGYGRILWGDLFWIRESVKASRRRGYLRCLLKMSSS